MATTREAAIEHLRAVLDQFLAQLAVDDEAQWHRRPSEGEWSLADAAEHVAKSNRARPIRSSARSTACSGSSSPRCTPSGTRAIWRRSARRQGWPSA